MPNETYTPGYDPLALAYMKRRNVESAAAFFTPLLKPGLALLDCGCGPGTRKTGGCPGKRGRSYSNRHCFHQNIWLSETRRRLNVAARQKMDRLR